MSVGLHSSDFAGHLTQLYTETKKSALSNATKDTANDTTPAITSLHRKFRIQKDRLITWGIEWSDEGNGSDGNIDESIARAGVTETVTSVLENIREVLQQAERIHSASTPTRSPAWPSVTPEKSFLLAVDIPRYRDLVTDLTTSIDILYDLSRTRRALVAAGSDKFRSASDEKAALYDQLAAEQAQGQVAQQSSNFQSQFLGLPPAIDVAALILPEEGPPPYSNAGVSTTTRMVGRLLRAHCPDEVRFALQESFDDPLVLIEYANFDTLYRENRVTPPMSRLEDLSRYLQQAVIRPQLNLLGYFEDPKEPRMGLIFDISECHIDNDFNTSNETGPIETYDLLQLLQSSSNKAKSHDTLSATPSLEDRFKLALNVADRVQDLHENDGVHGNLNSGSILFVKIGEQERSKSGLLRSPVLGSFDLFSKCQIEGQANKDVLNIYQHPADQSRDFEISSALKYDAYGLGLTLLEIGLWSPLSELHKAKYNLSDFKMRLERIWIPRLASKCGSMYMRAVEACFSFSDLPLHVDHQQAIQLYETTTSRLRRCCLLCDETSTLSSPRQSAIFSSIDPTQSKHPSTPRGLRNRASLRSDLPQTPSRAIPERRTTHPDAQRSGTRLPSIVPTAIDGFGIDTIKDGISAAASNLQDVWSGNRGALQRAWSGNQDAAGSPFKEYRRCVVLLQNRWRERQQKRASTVDVETSPEAELRRAATAPADVSLNEDLSSSARDPPGTQPRQRAFPVNLPPQQLVEWHSNLGLRLSRIVERALENSFESSTIDLVGIGTDESNAKPTILVTCTSTAQVKAAIKKRFKCDRNMFDVKVRKGSVSLSRRCDRGEKEGTRTARRQLVPRTSESLRRSQARLTYDSDEEDEPQNPYYHARPSCGASIGAYNKDEGHLLPVTFGGVILVDEEPYGMTVHHMLEPLSDDEDDAAFISADEADDESDTFAGASINASESDDVPDLVIAPSNAEVPRSRARAPRRRAAPSDLIDRVPHESRPKQPASDLPRRSSAKQIMDATSTTVSQKSSTEEYGRQARLTKITPNFSARSPSPTLSISDVDFSSIEDESDFSSDFDSDAEESQARPSAVPSAGDTRAFDALAPITSEWRITQPGLLDAQSTGWHQMDQDQMDTDEDHLASFDLGRLYASSGLRRHRDDQGLLHEIDWALFTIKADRQQTNLILGGRRHLRPSSSPRPSKPYRPTVKSPVLRSPTADQYGTRATGKACTSTFPATQDFFPHTTIDPAKVAGSRVFCSGRTSGLATGIVGPALSFVKIYGRTTFSSSWTVIGEFGVGGDSGAWVVSCAQGAVCGAVLAEKGGVAYFAPMSVLLEDIRGALGAKRVALPGPETAAVSEPEEVSETSQARVVGDQPQRRDTIPVMSKEMQHTATSELAMPS